MLVLVMALLSFARFDTSSLQAQGGQRRSSYFNIPRDIPKIFLILDNLRVHHSKLVEEWLQANKRQIEVFFLPAYSPELNPDEYLNCDLKAGVHSGAPARNAEGLKKKIVSHMRKLQKLPARVASYFQHPKLQYAA